MAGKKKKKKKFQLVFRLDSYSSFQIQLVFRLDSYSYFLEPRGGHAIVSVTPGIILTRKKKKKEDPRKEKNLIVHKKPQDPQ